MAKTFECQVKELHIRAALINRFSQLCRPVTVAAGFNRLGFEEWHLKSGLCNSATQQLTGDCSKVCTDKYFKPEFRNAFMP